MVMVFMSFVTSCTNASLIQQVSFTRNVGTFNGFVDVSIMFYQESQHAVGGSRPFFSIHSSTRIKRSVVRKTTAASSTTTVPAPIIVKCDNMGKTTASVIVLLGVVLLLLICCDTDFFDIINQKLWNFAILLTALQHRLFQGRRHGAPNELLIKVSHIRILRSKELVGALGCAAAFKLKAKCVVFLVANLIFFCSISSIVLCLRSNNKNQKQCNNSRD
mmetsp:Transcript_30901/g.45784  ORF Transcript_30901/g.45784 Transcript_30901/m.45784 type:complete len:218 (+) Transcript_30901:217-870(+)